MSSEISKKSVVPVPVTKRRNANNAASATSNRNKNNNETFKLDGGSATVSGMVQFRNAESNVDGNFATDGVAGDAFQMPFSNSTADNNNR